jgi:cell division protease FtsH
LSPQFNPKKFPGPGRPMVPNWTRYLFWFLALFIVLSLIGRFMNKESTRISYTTFRQQLAGGNVQQVTVKGEKITGTLRNPVKTEKKEKSEEASTYKDFVTYLPSFGDRQLMGLLEKEKVKINTEPAESDTSFSMLIGFLPLILIIGLGYFLIRRLQQRGQGLFSMGRSQAHRYERRNESTTFADVAGSRGAKMELAEIIDYLKHPGRFQKIGGKIPKGVLLMGPPGTGKTLLARAVAGEAGVPFFSIAGSAFMEMFVGVGASRVRDMFREAKKDAPAIIFIDELDSIGRKRGAGLGGGHDEREQTLNQLLSELDGFEPNMNVIVMAATNRPDILDPALLRPGRFDRHVTVDLPTMEDRLKILKIHARNKPLANEDDLEDLARATPGLSGADLENVLNEAALLAARKGKEKIEKADIEDAQDKVLIGLERENLGLSERDRRMLAYHEGGHSVTASLLPNADPIHKATIVPRGRAMGVTQQLPEKEKYIYPREYLMDRLAVMLGGRAAEDLVLQTMTSGAENDLKQATILARKMVLDWGMSEKLGNIAWSGPRENVFLGEEIAQRREYSEATAREIDEEVKKILAEAYKKSAGILEKNRDGLDRVADALMKKEEITGEEIHRLLDQKQKAEPEPERQPVAV